MDMATLIGNLVAIINGLRNNSGDPAIQQKLGALLSEVLFPLWDAALNQRLTQTDPLYVAATAQLTTATKAAQAARRI
jgi:hypothetical protein